MQLVETDDGSFTLHSPDFKQSFHSNCGARKESQDLYIQSSGFCQALAGASKLSVLDVGLGLGYNAVATINSWLKSVQPHSACDLHIISLEQNKHLIDELISTEASWQHNWPQRELDMLRSIFRAFSLEQTQLQWQHPEYPLARLTWTFKVGNAIQFLSSDETTPLFDFIWQDPFSPQINAELWTREWFEYLRRHSHQKTKLLTYSVSRVVKDNLEGAGWRWELLPTTTKKRSWLIALPNTEDLGR
jgi:tRNA U34 5-methylaminomethyl-2-thiouridine-forming methyltransferase MnmC